jgi:hypothetical protein
MGTLNIQVSGFGSMPAAVSNTFTTYSDADFQRTLNWGAVYYKGWIQQTYNPSNQPNFTPTNTQIWHAIVQNLFINGLINAEFGYQTVNHSPPPSIVIGA